MGLATRLCEEELVRKIGKKHCILTGRGTTALWLSYSLMDKKRPKVLLPAMVCLSPMFTAFYAGKIPIFADVLKEDATINPAVVEKMLKGDSSIGAVVAVHLYGHPARMKELKVICSKYNVLLIEDAAQALGGIDYDGELLGYKGDLSIFSFGHTKIMDVGGGGAVLTDNDAWAEEIRQKLSSLATKPSKAGKIEPLYGKLYYTIWESGKVDPSFYRLFDFFPELFKPLYLYRITEEISKKILEGMKNLEEELAHRKSIEEYYRKELRGIRKIVYFNPSTRIATWRFTFRVPASCRDAVVNIIRKENLDVSSWYPNISQWTPSGRCQKESCFVVANQLEKEVINLWVTRDYTLSKAARVVRLIKKYFSREKR